MSPNSKYYVQVHPFSFVARCRHVLGSMQGSEGMFFVLNYEKGGVECVLCVKWVGYTYAQQHSQTDFGTCLSQSRKHHNTEWNYIYIHNWLREHYS